MDAAAPNWLLPLLSGFVGLGAALIVSGFERFRHQSNAAAFVRLKLASYADEVRSSFEIAEQAVESGAATEVEQWRLAAGQFLDETPRVDPLLEERLGQVAGVSQTLDEKLVDFHEAATSARRRFERVRREHDDLGNALLDGEMDVVHGLTDLARAARAARCSIPFLEELFGSPGTVLARLRLKYGDYTPLTAREMADANYFQKKEGEYLGRK